MNTKRFLIIALAAFLTLGVSASPFHPEEGGESSGIGGVHDKPRKALGVGTEVYVHVSGNSIEVSEEWRRQNDANKPTVTEEDVAQVIATMTGVPVTKLTEGESERLLKLEDTLHARVIGQSDAVVAISKAINIPSFSLVINSYCGLLGIDGLYSYTRLFAITICAFEFLIGIGAFIKPCQRVLIWVYPAVMAFFVYITYINYTDLYGGIESCGCFGELIHFTPASSFYKNLALFALSLVLFGIHAINVYRQKSRYIPCLLAVLLLGACQNRLDNALEQAGDNRQELEKVLNHYKDDPDTLKYGAAIFLIENMPYHYTYQDADMLQYDSAYVAMAQEQEQFRDSVFMNRLGSSISLKPVFDIQHVKADFLIRMIDDACEAWHAASWSKDYDTSYFYEYVLPYRLLNEPLSFWRDSLAANYSYLRKPGIRSFRGYKIEAEQAASASCEHVLSEFASNKEALVFRHEKDSVSFRLIAYRPEQKITYLCYSTGKKHSSAVVCLDGLPQDTIRFLPTQSL